MSKVWLFLVVLISLSTLSCSSHNPFEGSRSEWRVDGEFVDFKTLALPGTYTSLHQEDLRQGRLTIDDDGNLTLDQIDLETLCRITARGQVLTVRTLNPLLDEIDEVEGFESSQAAGTLSFGNYKGNYDNRHTHFMVLSLSSFTQEIHGDLDDSPNLDGEPAEQLAENASNSESSPEDEVTPPCTDSPLSKRLVSNDELLVQPFQKNSNVLFLDEGFIFVED